MRRKAVVAAALLTLAGPVAAVDDDTCVRIAKAVSDVELAMVGMGELGSARQELVSLRDATPSMRDELDAMVRVAEKAENSKPSEPSHPINTGEYDKADAEYQKKYREECGEL
ncbi:hypothetical protein [Alloalcanivorax marinus]|uniref:hypothetical protein n=1 Tax=Alloalcanivorax marinus TaxID=1177169 RepID=UPI0019321177|nr:hypothetical protein [Alloalcanivorax marinus]MBL7250944.1 hypothetical protein [Alloalcanivorax marinus]